MHFIDTHCHLDDEMFDVDYLEIIRSCVGKNVKQFIIPGVTASLWERLFQICQESENLFAAPGLHPCFASQHSIEHATALVEIINSHRSKVVAIGECGLDGYEAEADIENQTKYFELQIEIAKQLKLPLILHARKTHDQILKLIRIKRFTGGGIVHCYSGSLQQAEHYVDFGFKLGIGGVLTYERSRRLHRIVSTLPLTAFVLETDAPDIPIAGRQRTRNSPEYLPEIYQAFVKHRQEPETQIMNQLYLNTLTLFPALRTHK